MDEDRMRLIWKHRFWAVWLLNKTGKELIYQSKNEVSARDAYDLAIREHGKNKVEIEYVI